MGITGLIPFLEKASSKVHLKNLRGSTVAIDSYCWLHKGVFGCAEKLVRGEDTDQYLNYCLKYVEMLLSYDIKPILVFDGQHLPAKALTEKRRRDARQESKKRAAELLRLGKVAEARSHLRRCVDVTHEMALRLIRECRLRNVDCIVAPYEADAQLAWLNKANIAQYIITEDSDLALFGARNIIFKLDLSGMGLLVEAEKFHLAMGCPKDNYDFENFRRMCILSGCDYLDSLPGIGLAKACKFMLKTAQENMFIALKKLPQYLNMKQLEVDDEYIENFMKAEATFKHMYIFNPLSRKNERLYSLEELQTEERFCSNAGVAIDDDEQALHLAVGNLNPFTRKQMDNWHPDKNCGMSNAPPKHIKRAKHKSIWLRTFQKSDLVNKNLEKDEKKNCALFFKKVDFLSKTIKEDINASLIEESAKPAEVDVFKMYRQEADEQSFEIKRKREESDNEEESEIESLNLSNSGRCNPFAKSLSSSIDRYQTQNQSICVNSSLLKVLSPKKFKEESQRITRNSFKRSIFSAEEETVEVRSRFFAENVKLVKEHQNVTISQHSAPSTPAIDVSEEIDKIERLSQQQAECQALLYNSPSPDKPSKYTKLSYTDSGIESLNSVENNNDEIDKETSPISLIELSEDDFEDKDLKSKRLTKATITKTPLKRNAFKQKQMPKIGLSKTKSKSQKTKSDRNTKLANNSDHQQTRLSMFGFQKKTLLN